MRLRIAAVGRLRASPEADLVSDYRLRFDRTGRPLSLGPLEIVEVEDKKGGRQKAEAEMLAKAVPDAAHVVALDERGAVLSSPQFSTKLADWRDAGHRDCVFLIGGADGIARDLLATADFKLSFGKMVWPHMLARVMLAEQLYRASTILSGGPYHRV